MAQPSGIISTPSHVPAVDMPDTTGQPSPGEMTEAVWLTCDDPVRMLEYLYPRNGAEVIWPPLLTDRQIRLLACAYARHAWHLLTDPRSRDAVLIAERCADDNSTNIPLGMAIYGANNAQYECWQKEGDPFPASDRPAWSAALLARTAVVLEPADIIADLCDQRYINAAIDVPSQVALIRDIAGNPFRKVTLPLTENLRFDGVKVRSTPILSRPSPLLTYNDGLIVKMAQTIYDNRTFEQLPILADALEDAGCTDPVILAHCRNREHPDYHGDERPPALHARGCWVIDLLRGMN